jgi:hypothetical protein
MKLDKLESYIKDNRESIDQINPPESLWAKIESGLQPVSKKNLMIYWQAAAVIFFALSIGLLVKNYQTSNELNSYVFSDTEFADTEQYYIKVIQDKEVLLTSSLQLYPELAADFKNDLNELSKNYQKLKADFDNNRSEEVLNALIKNLRLQQDLLNNQIKIIHLINEENENVSI